MTQPSGIQLLPQVLSACPVYFPVAQVPRLPAALPAPAASEDGEAGGTAKRRAKGEKIHLLSPVLSGGHYQRSPVLLRGWPRCHLGFVPRCSPPQPTSRGYPRPAAGLGLLQPPFSSAGASTASGASTSWRTASLG